MELIRRAKPWVYNRWWCCPLNPLDKAQRRRNGRQPSPSQPHPQTITAITRETSTNVAALALGLCYRRKNCTTLSYTILYYTILYYFLFVLPGRCTGRDLPWLLTESRSSKCRPSAKAILWASKRHNIGALVITYTTSKGSFKRLWYGFEP